MPGLILNIKPGERFLVNGVVLENGPKRAQIRVETEGASILRLSDALHPDDVNTPVKRVYYIAQLILTGDSDEAEAKELLIKSIKDLQNVFRDTAKAPLEKALNAAEIGRYYSVLCSLKHVFPLEEKLLNLRLPQSELEAEKQSEVA
ncbi:MAG: flagellar biosynthesis repressor FlbT [Aquisalinus sp.]|nr:flagellar biosynthesis repressor FlbT [Aquisalinus sp.]